MLDSRPSVLIVDDEQRDLDGLEKTLRSIRLKTWTLKDPHEVLQKVEVDAPDLVILDALLPGMSGFDLCKQIKSAPATKSTSVIILTGVYLREHYRRDAIRQFKADGFVTKPYREKDLQRLVMRLLAKKLKTSPAALQEGLAPGEDIFPPPAAEVRPGWLGRLFGRWKGARAPSVSSGFLHTAPEEKVATAPSADGAKDKERGGPGREEAGRAGAELTDKEGVEAVGREAILEAREREESKAPGGTPPENGSEAEFAEQRAAELVGERKAAEALETGTVLPTDVEEELWKAATMEPLTVAEPRGEEGGEAGPDRPAVAAPGQGGETVPVELEPTAAPEHEEVETATLGEPGRGIEAAQFRSSVDAAEPKHRDDAAEPGSRAETTKAVRSAVATEREGLGGELPIYPEADFLHEVRREVLKCKRVDRPLTLILIRVADLGQIVELFGKQFRPKVLRHVAIQALESLREVDMVGLLTTKQLLALTAFASSRYGGERIVNRLQATLGHNPFRVGEGIPSFIPKLRFGMAAYPKDGATLEDLLERAEKEMEAAGR